MSDTIRLRKGAHQGADGACLAEIVSLLQGGQMMNNGVVAPNWRWRDKTDRPTCMSSCVYIAVHNVNDRLDSDARQRLVLLVPRLLRARPGRTNAAEHRIRRRVAIWAARSVLDKIEDEGLRARCAKRLDAAEEALWDEPPTVLHVPKGIKLGKNKATTTVVAYATDPTGRNAHSAITMAVKCLADDELALWLSDLLDAHDKARAEEGDLAWDPTIEYPSDDDVNAVIEAVLAGREP